MSRERLRRWLVSSESFRRRTSLDLRMLGLAKLVVDEVEDEDGNQRR